MRTVCGDSMDKYEGPHHKVGLSCAPYMRIQKNTSCKCLINYERHEYMSKTLYSPGHKITLRMCILSLVRKRYTIINVFNIFGYLIVHITIIYYGSNEILFHQGLPPRVAAFTIDFKMLSAHIIIKYSGANIASPLLCLRASTYIDN